jgi:hypothetical protein
MTTAHRQENPVISWMIDRGDRIVQVNDAWLAFARENAAPELTREAVVNRTLWFFIAGLNTISLYQLILGKVRSHQLQLSYPFRCDSPDCRRFLEMEISPLPEEGIHFRSEVLRLEYRQPVRVLDAEVVERSNQFLKICSWCKKIYAQGKWVEIEEALDLLNLFSEVEQPQLTHGICEACGDLVLKDLPK